MGKENQSTRKIKKIQCQFIQHISHLDLAGNKAEYLWLETVS
jgi:hypothetical protein